MIMKTTHMRTLTRHRVLLMALFLVAASCKKEQNSKTTDVKANAVLEDSSINYVDPTPTSSTAALFVWGYLWSDSPGGNKATWSYSHHPAKGGIVDPGDPPPPTAPALVRFQQAAVLMGATVNSQTRTGSGVTGDPYIDHINVTFTSNLNVDLLPMPPVMVGASKGRTSGFLAAVIEGEGNKGGLIADDWYQDHLDIVTTLLTRMGVNSAMKNDGQPDPPASGQKFKKVHLVDQAGVDEVNNWPYVEFSRVPSGFTNWDN